MATPATVENAEGNTGNLRAKYRGWSFTYNMKDATTLATVEPESGIIDALNMSCVDTWCFQLERGANGTYHYQGQMYFSGARTRDCVRRILGRAHVEPLRDCKSSLRYVTKEDSTFVRGPWAKGIQVIYKEATIWNDRAWQKSLREKIDGPKNDREIIWIADHKGNMGKTVFAKHLIQSRANTLFVSGKAADAQYAISKLVAEGKAPKLVLFGFPRSKEAYVSYEAMENIKDGLFFNSKYESGMVCFDSPVVVVMANFAPKREQMTADRWSVYSINDDMELVAYEPTPVVEQW